MMKTYGYYLVTAKCGHVGRNRYMPIDFPIKAASGSEAAAIARLKRRVKKDHKDAIIAVREVSFEEYLAQIAANRADPYLSVRSRHAQAQIMPEIICRLKSERRADNIATARKRDCVEYRMKKNRLLLCAKEAELREYASF